MALSGTVSGTYRGYTYQILWSASQNISGNYSTITCTHKLVCASTYALYINSRTNSCTVNGSSASFVSNSISTGGGTTITLGTTKHTINHNSNGTANISITGTFKMQATINGTYVEKITASGSATLNTIPRTSSFGSISGNTIGSNMTVNINRNSSSFTHQLWYQLGSSGWYDLGKGIGTQKSFTISNDLLSQLPSATSGTLQLCLRTYNGNTQIGSDVYKNVTVYVSGDVKPSVGTITLTPATINNKPILVQNKNRLTIAVSGCSAGSGSSIKSYTFSGPSISSTTTSTSVTGGPVSNTGTLTYTVTVTDNRNRTASSTKTITCYEYFTPYFTSFSAYRANSNGTANNKGTYMKVTYGVKYAPVNNTNSATVKIYGAGSTVTASGGSALINLNGDTTSSYQIYAIVTDSYGGKASSASDNVFGETRILNVTKDGTGVAIGKVAESNELFECRWDAKFDGAVSGPSGFATSSDRRVKKNIQDLNIDIVDDLRPVQYELIEPKDGKVHYGFIAQDVNEVLANEGVDPKTVGLIGSIMNNEQQQYVLSYTEFIPLLTKKCQTLQAETNELKAEIIELKNMIKQTSSN